jgi:hypothetical protein
MKRRFGNQVLLVLAVLGIVLLAMPGSRLLCKGKRLQIELYGGISATSPDDLNLFSRAEEQYNDIFFYRYVGYLPGSFSNDFPEIASVVPLGIRLKYHISSTLALSLGLEGFRRQRQESVTGTFTLPEWDLEYSKKYDSYRLTLSHYSVLAGLHYLIPLGTRMGIELGLAAGWARGKFSFDSSWTYDVVFHQPIDINMSYHDGATLAGDGEGDGWAARGSVRLNRSLTRGFGFFIEGRYTYCRLKEFQGSGRESRWGIPGETTWSGRWGIKREELHTTWYDATVYVPGNYWEGWVETQRERDFILDLSGLSLAVGLYVRF